MPPVSARDLPRGNESVLLVEPDPETRALAAFMLKRLGYRVSEAHHGAEAIAIHEQRDGGVDLLLTEAAMARMNGHDLAQALRERQPGLRVLFLADAEYGREARRAPTRKHARFLCRPFTMASLAAGVRAAIDNGRGNAIAAGEAR